MNKLEKMVFGAASLLASSLDAYAGGGVLHELYRNSPSAQDANIGLVVVGALSAFGLAAFVYAANASMKDEQLRKKKYEESLRIRNVKDELSLKKEPEAYK
ncbi:MAG: hypothetical protein ACMXYK_05430 [Candidatus Woesearchaeota archaeon]